MITFTCEFCSRKYRVDDGLAGRKVKCKECGTELAIPSPGKAAPAASAPKVDLYGLDDQDEAPLPPPRRPGLAPEASPSRGGSRPRSRSSSENESQLQKVGFSLMVGGVLAFVLPLVGLQIKGLHALSPEAQMGGGVALLILGGFLAILGRVGFLKGMAWTVGGGVGLVVLILVAASFRGPRAPRGAPGNFGPPPGIPGGGVFMATANSSRRVSITGGRAMPGRGPGQFGGTGGVSFEIDYRLDPSAAGLYDLCIKSSRGITRIVPPVHLMPSGTVGVTVPQMDRNEGPFEAHFERQGFGPDAGGQEPASDSVTLTWTETPQPAPNNPFENMPGPPGNMPGQPGFRPPGMPVGPFGPRGPR